MTLEPAGLRQLQQPVVGAVAVSADEHARLRTGQPLHRLATGLESLPRYFEQQALLRVHHRRLARSDTEEPRVELVERVEEAAASRIDPVRCGRVGVEEGLAVPPVTRYIGHDVASIEEQLPELIRRPHTAW